MFTVIPETRGLGIHQVITRNDTVFAISKTKVYSFGGAGLGVGQVNLDPNSIHKNSEFKALFGHLIFKMQQSGLMDRAVLILVGYLK